jgi:hypothetical protein
MIQFRQLPKVRRDEINLVVRAIDQAFKSNKFDRKGLVAKIRQNLLFMYNNEFPVTGSIFSEAYKTAYNANGNEALNDFDSLDTNALRIRMRGFDMEIVDGVFSIQQTGSDISIVAPATANDFQIVALGVMVRSDGTSVVQVDSQITPSIIPVVNPFGGAGVGSINPLHEGFSLQYVFLITKGYKHNSPKAGKPVKYSPDSKSLDGITLLPILT